jgi:hypothetical protein
MTHLPLNPVERFVLLQRQDREAVTTLPDLSVGNFRPLENPTPHHVGRSPHVGSTAAPVGEDELAAELDSFPLLEQFSCWPRILKRLHPEQQIFVEEFSNASEVQDLAEDIPTPCSFVACSAVRWPWFASRQPVRGFRAQSGRAIGACGSCSFRRRRGSRARNKGAARRRRSAGGDLAALGDARRKPHRGRREHDADCNRQGRARQRAQRLRLGQVERAP